MPNVQHIATINAYELQAGGFRGVMLIYEGKVRTTSEVLDTLEAAKFWAQNEAWKMYNGCRLAPTRRKGEYFANVWINA